jgi:hypothetical protein
MSNNIVPRFIFTKPISFKLKPVIKIETKYYSQKTLSKYYKCKTQKNMEMIDCAVQHSRCLTCPYSDVFRTHPGGDPCENINNKKD